MKVSDLMLDLATGDSSVHDAFIQEAAGKVAVSNAIFQAAYKISELPVGSAETYDFVQEAAEVGLPTDPKKARGLACASVNQELAAFYDLVVATAKKVKEATEKSMKLILAAGKKYNISADSGDFENSFVKPLCAAIGKDKGKMSFDKKQFLKGKFSAKIASNYAKGMCCLLAAYGVNIEDSVKNTSSLKSACGCNQSVTSLSDVESNLSNGGKLIAFDNIVSQDSHYTDSVKASDVCDLAMGIYDVLNISKAVIAAASTSAKKTAKLEIDKLCASDAGKDKKISRAAESINDDIKTWTANVTSVTDSIVKGYCDSVSTLTEAMN